MRLTSVRTMGLSPCLLGAAVTGLWLGCAARPPAAAAATDRWASAIDAAHHIAADLHQREGMPGLSVAVVVGHETEWAEAFGFADTVAGRRATTETRFRLASVSKLLTAAAAAKLVEAGRLDVDAPISRWVNALPEALTAITPRQLASHLGGIRHYGAKDFLPTPIDDRVYPSVTASLAVFAKDPLVAPPGTKVSYSTFGFTLLAAALEGASGKDFLTLLAESVAEPLALRSLAADRRDVVMPDRSQFYDRDAGGRVAPARPINPSYKWAGGGLVATARDLARFGAAHCEVGFFRPQTLALLFTPSSTAGGEPTEYGFGWRLGHDPTTNLDVVHHAGSQEGARAFLLVYREAKVAVAVLSNLGGVPAEPEVAARAIARPFLETLGTVDPAAAGDPAAAYTRAR